MASEPWSARADTPHHPDGLSVAAEAEAEAPPLSVAQEALWQQSVLLPQEIVYNELVALHHEGPLDVAALCRALEELVARHEIWRTTFDTVEGHAIQVVHPAPSFELPVLDLSQLSAAQAEDRAVQVMADVCRVPYDVRRGPLLRPRLMRIRDGHHRLYLALHHMIFDGVSISRVILPELAALHQAFAAGRPSPLAAPATQYSEFARRDQANIEGPRAQRRIAYWREHLAGIHDITLPTDRPRAETPRFRGGAIGLEVPASTVTRLRSIAQDQGATLFQALAAAWSLVLGRWAGQHEVVLGTPADMRRRPEVERMVGYCLTPMIVRVNLEGTPTFAELVHRTRNEVLDGLDQLVPFERLVRELRPDRRPGANPIYQTMIVLEPPAEATDSGWSLTLTDARAADALGSTRMDLELQLDERAAGHLEGRLIFDRDLFERATAQRLAEHLVRVIEAGAEAPELRAWEMPLLTAAEEHRQVVEWNATAAWTAPAPATVDELVTRRTDRDPSAPAVSDGERTLSYGELRDRAEAVAMRLRAAGIGGGDLVAVCGEPSAGLVAAALGTLRAGAAHRLIDPQLPADHRTALIAGSRATAVLNLAPDGEEELQRWGDEHTAGVDPEICCLVDAGAAVPGAATHAGVVNLASALAAELSLTAADAVLALPSMLYDSSVTDLWPALGAGARLVLLTREQATAGSALSRRVRAERATLLHADPSTWRRLVESGLRSSRTLRALCSPGRLDRDLADAILARCRVLFNAHGSPYATGLSTFAQIASEGPITIGRPLANCRAYVVDRLERPVAVGITGRLLLAGVGVTAPAGSAGADDPPGEVAGRL